MSMVAEFGMSMRGAGNGMASGARGTTIIITITTTLGGGSG